MTHPFLSWWEVLLTRLLMRSPRVGTVVIRQYGTNIHWVLYASNDPFLAQSPQDIADDLEPPSMLLERMYHAPDASR